ncbi:DUF2971 domain-containing protein [Celeribacter baekdonensis]|uniref:DUF2971 domain-containing protein n=1 Tax=Celeribacter baekdonensis TaxID=875171 RepID=UPI003A90F4C5
MPQRLHRYTSFSSLVHMLLNKQITLLDPQGWDDRNDAYFLEAYRKKVTAEKVYALCFTEAQQKYHHWSVFASGAEGVCISFYKEKLIQAASSADGFEFKKVKYIGARDAEKDVPFDDDGLKFTKNLRYSDEKEWRLVYTDRNGLARNPTVPFELEIIERITISPWLAKPLITSVRSTIKLIPECSRLKVNRSTLVDYKDWKSIADRSINPKQ